MSTDEAANDGTWYSSLNEEERTDLVARVAAQLEDQDGAKVPRRGLLKAAGVGMAGLSLGAGAVASEKINADNFVHRASAQSTAAGQVGTASEPVDVFASAVDTDELSLTDPTLVYAFGEGGNLRSVRDPSNFTDVFAAVNDIISSVGDTEQVTIQLPYTGSAGVNASTSLTIPTGQVHPNIIGWGEAAGTVINVTTDISGIDNQSSTNETGYRWARFTLNGPGSGTAGGIYVPNSNNHTVELSHLKVQNFGGNGIRFGGGLFSGSINHCSVKDNGSTGIFANRLNGGSIANCLVQGNTGTQIRLDGCYAGVVFSNDIDAGAGSTAPAGSIGVQVRNVSNRAGPMVMGNYFESNETHVELSNGGVPVRGASVAFNRMHQGTTGVHVVDNVNRSFITYNLFEGIGTQDILLDGTSMVLGPNSHVSSTVKLTDNTAGAFDSVSQTAGSYPW